MQEIIKQLKECQTKKCRITYNDIKLFFTRDEKNNWWVQRAENSFYGLIITDSSKIIYSYPHLHNIKPNMNLNLAKYCLELKVNGSNIIVSKYDNDIIIRTRMSIADELPIPPFWNSNINAIMDETIRNEVLSIRNEMVSKYPQYIIFEADGEYIGLKYKKLVEDILPVKTITDTFLQYVFYFELIGRLNTIFIDDKFRYGKYSVDYDLILFDIFDKQSHIFLNRHKKEEIANILKLKLVPILHTFSTLEELQKAIPLLKEEADTKLIEGMVLKPLDGDIRCEQIIKVKSDIVLDSAHRMEAIMKGYIGLNDMYNYISKVVTLEYLKHPEKFDELVELVGIEALADYPEAIITKQKKSIQKNIAHHMAILITAELIKEKTFASPDELYRYLNLEIPERFEPLRAYIDFKLEKSTKDKELREKIKHRRVELFNKVRTYCMKTLNINGGKY